MLTIVIILGLILLLIICIGVINISVKATEIYSLLKERSSKDYKE